MGFVVSAQHLGPGADQVSAVVIIRLLSTHLEGRGSDQKMGGGFSDSLHHEPGWRHLRQKIERRCRFRPDNQIGPTRASGQGQPEVFFDRGLLKCRLPFLGLLNVALDDGHARPGGIRRQAVDLRNAHLAVTPCQSDQCNRRRQTGKCEPPSDRFPAPWLSGDGKASQQESGIGEGDQSRKSVHTEYIQYLDQMQLPVLGVAGQLPRKTREQERSQEIGGHPEYREDKQCPRRRTSGQRKPVSQRGDKHQAENGGEQE